MTLGERLDQAAEDWKEGAVVAFLALLLASLGLGATYFALRLIAEAVGKDDAWASIWAGGSGLIWYPLALGAVSRRFRAELDKGALTQTPAADGDRRPV
jgi:hypothetical protein